MRARRFTGSALAALFLTSCAATPGSPAGEASSPPSPRPAPNVYEVAPEQGRDAPRPDTTGVLEVSGSGEVRVDPDRARITFAVETEDSTAARASAENARRMSRVHDTLEGLDLPGLTVETFGYHLQPRYGRPEPERGGSPRIEGYRATNFIRVVVDDVDAVGRVLDAAIDAGANRTTGLVFEATETEDARAEALRRAVTTARREAEAIAGALGVELGPPLEVRADDGRDGRPAQMAARQEVLSMQQAPETPVEAARQTVSASVTVRYRLGPPR